MRTLKASWQTWVYKHVVFDKGWTLSDQVKMFLEVLENIMHIYLYKTNITPLDKYLPTFK